MVEGRPQSLFLKEMKIQSHTGIAVLQAGQEARVELQLSDDSTEVHFDFHG
jgi:hypothetical protein